MRLTRILLPVLALAVLVGCARVDEPLGKTGGKYIKWSKKREGSDHYLSARVKKGAGANGFVLLYRDLWPPFRWETTLMLPGTDTPSGGSFGTELDAKDSNPLQFYGISVQPTAGGLYAFAASHQSSPGTHGEKFYSGARKVDVAIEHDGTNLRFYSRAHGSTKYDLLAEINASTGSLPLQPAVGLFGMLKGDEVGFDEFRVVSNGTPPGELTEAQLAIGDLMDAVDAQVEAMHAMDGDDPDGATAKTELAASLVSLDGAIATVDGIPDATKKAKKNLKKARKKLLSAQKKLDKGKSGKAIIKGLEKVIKPEFLAAEELK
jgi:hypothetical protein